MDDIARDINIVAIAELIGDPSRIIMLNNALTNQDALPAGELAYGAGISPQTASAHLTKLVDGGLLTLTAHGRHRYYSLAGPEVAATTWPERWMRPLPGGCSSLHRSSAALRIGLCA